MAVTRAASIAQQMFEPELEILPVLASVLKSRRAVDIGANRGSVTTAMRAAGFSVDSYEPLPQLAAELRQRFASDPQVRVHEVAVSDRDGMGELKAISQDAGEFDATLFSSLVSHPTFEGLSFDDIIQVKTRRLDSLEAPGADPIGLLKVDTEGHDLAVIQGMGELRPEAVLLEVWDKEFVFNQGKTKNRLIDYIRGMDKDYYKYSAMFWRDSRSSQFGIMLNAVDTCPAGWGNVLFVHELQCFNAVRGFLQARYRRVADAANFF